MSKRAYPVTITEKISKTFYVEAASKEEAEQITREMYRNCELVIIGEGDECETTISAWMCPIPADKVEVCNVYS